MLMYCANGPAWDVNRLAATFLLLAVGLFLAFATMAAASETESRPSILVVVLDTVRKDAVSAYGKVAGTTPNFDRIAENGVRYTYAFSSAPWTIPSHASLFTGRSVDEHRLSMPGVNVLSLEFETLAERLRDAGYETAVFSENTTVSDVFGLVRGFEVRESSALVVSKMHYRKKELNASEAFRSWIARRDTSRPFFAFVNIMDAHTPYPIRDVNPWVPESIPKHQVIDRHPNSERQICGAIPPKDQLAVLRGLYLGGVHVADRKLGEIVAAARESLGDQRLITLVTSDHGELFGEDRMLGHEFSVSQKLLAVPLVVNGLEGLKPGVIETPVGLVDVMPTILEWVGVDRPADLAGLPLPLDGAGADAAPPRTFFSAYTDRFITVPDAWKGKAHHVDKDVVRQFCVESNRVFGGMASLIRYPFKYVWYERYAPSLYDLSWDPNERSDQLKYRGDLAESFAAEMKRRVDASRISERTAADSQLSEEALETLKQLGYVY
jgi:arylsulfatase A-like enzyme